MSECTFISMISTVSYVKVTLSIILNSCWTAKKPHICVQTLFSAAVESCCTSFLPLRADLEQLPSPLVPWAVVPNLYLHPVFSPSPTRGFSLHYLRTAMLDGILVSRGSCCLSTCFFPPPPLGGRPWLPTGPTALAGRLQIGHAVSFFG